MIRSVIEYFLGEKDAPEFALWAFGCSYKDGQRLELLEAWNKLHGDKLILDATGKFREDIPKMIDIWAKETGQVLNLNNSNNVT